MSYEEKGIWVYLVTSAGAYAVYLIIIAGRLASTPAAQVPYIAVLLWTAGASMVANMAGRILVETASPSDSRRADVRDRDVSRFGEYVSRLAGDFCFETDPNCAACPLRGECVVGQTDERCQGGGRSGRPKPR